jgi:hypothetical protein
MRFMGVRRAMITVALTVLPALTGCGALGLGDPAASASAEASTGPGDSWVVVEEGQATASPTPARRTASPTASSGLPTTSPTPGCPDDRTGGTVLIPVTVTVGPRSLTATWPRQRDSTYRIAAVPQGLVGGIQPAVVWQPVAAGSGCSVTATIRGLKSGKPYIVWLDAPGTGFEPDGSPHPYSGRSGVVYPR